VRLKANQITVQHHVRQGSSVRERPETSLNLKQILMPHVEIHPDCKSTRKGFQHSLNCNMLASWILLISGYLSALKTTASLIPVLTVRLDLYCTMSSRSAKHFSVVVEAFKLEFIKSEAQFHG